MDLFDVLKIVWRRKGIIFLAWFLSCCSAFAVSKLLPKAYEARATLIFPQQDGGAGALASFLSGTGLNKLSGMPGLSGLLGGSQASADVVEAMLHSRTLATRVVGACGLKRVYGTPSMERAVKLLQGATTIKRDKTDTLQVAVRAPSAPLAATVTNRTVDELQRMVDEKVDLFLARKNRRFVERQLSRARRDLTRAEDRLKWFEEAHGIVSLRDETRTAIENLAQIEKERALSKVSTADTEAQLLEVRRQIEAQTNRSVGELPAHSPVIRELRENLIGLNANLAVAREEFTEEHPTVRQLLAEAEETKRQIAAEVRRVRRSLDTGLAPELAKLEVERLADAARTTALDQIIGRYKSQFERLPEAALQFARLTRDREVQESLYTFLTAEYERARLMEAREGPGFVVLDRAVTPERHVFPRTLINVLIAGILGLWLGITLAMLLERAQEERSIPTSANGTGPDPRGATPFPEEVPAGRGAESD